MPAVSQKQQIAMNIAKAVQEGKATAQPGSPSAQMAQMPAETLNEFTGPVNKSLPVRKKATAVKNISKRAKKVPGW